MKIAIIGAGFTGLSSAYQLIKKGHKVTVFERDDHPGGLAIGYKEKQWDWTLEQHYHHWFTNDDSVLGLAREIGHKVLIKRPKTSVYVDGNIYQFDSPKEVLLFPKLKLIDRLRMAAVVGAIRYNPFWKPLEKFNASEILPKAMGNAAYKMIWEPQFHNKFQAASKDISLAWFWARLSKRTPSLAYPEEGFLAFANHLVKVIEKKGGKVIFGTAIEELSSDDAPQIKYKNLEAQAGGRARLRAERDRGRELKTENYDAVVVTLPTFLFMKITKGLPDEYKNKYKSLRGLGATNLVLRLSAPFFNNDTYWLSVCDTKAPVMAIVEHTNFMDKKYYNNEHLVYLGNYLPPDDPRYLLDKEEKLKLFDPFLRKINPEYRKHLLGYELFKAPFAQPIIPTNYSKMIPPMETPLKNIFLANIQQVYPWDRGTNYAVELGEKVSRLIQS